MWRQTVETVEYSITLLTERQRHYETGGEANKSFGTTEEVVKICLESVIWGG